MRRKDGWWTSMRSSPRLRPSQVSTTAWPLWKEAKTRMVKVSRVTVLMVRKVLSGRLRIPAMPMMIAAKVVLLALPVLCERVDRPWIAFNSCLNLPITTEITKPLSRMITKERKMISGESAIAKAGWVA